MQQEDQTSGAGEAVISLPRAAQRLGLSWEVCWRLMLRGRLIGRQLPSGRWAVTMASVKRYEPERAQRDADLAC